MRRELWFVGAFVLLIGFVTWLLTSRGPQQHTVTDSFANELESDQEREAATEPAAKSREPARSAGSDSAPTQREKRTSNGEITVAGTIVVIDPNGRRHEKANGSLKLVRWQGSSGSPIAVPVREGSWSAALRPGEKVSCSDATLEDRSVLCKHDRIVLPTPIPAEFRLELTGRWIGETTIRVIGEDTRGDLRGISVVRVQDFRRDSFVHPGNQKNTVVLSDVTSPITIPEPRPAREQATYWIRAPGYAWDKIEIRHGPTNPRELRLVRAGGIDVLFSRPPPKDSVLRLRPPPAERPRPPHLSEEEWQKLLQRFKDLGRRGMPIGEFRPAKQGLTSLRAIKPGRYELRLERGDWFETPQAFADAHVEVRAGDVRSLTMEVGAIQATLRVPVAGTIVVPPGWKVDSIAVEIDPLGKTAAHAERKYVRNPPRRGDGEYSWKAGKLPTGNYELVVEPFAIRRLLTVTPGMGPTRVVVPSPVDVAVTVIDKATRKPLRPDGVSWRTPLPKGVDGWSSESATIDKRTGIAHFRAPLGTIFVSARAEGYAGTFQTEEVKLRPGKNELTLELDRACGIQIVVKEGEATIPWEDGFHATLAVNGESAVRYWSAGKITAKGPGTYLLRVTTPKTYRPIEDRRVTVRPAEYTEVVIPVTKRQ